MKAKRRVDPSRRRTTLRATAPAAARARSTAIGSEPHDPFEIAPVTAAVAWVILVASAILLVLGVVGEVMHSLGNDDWRVFEGFSSSAFWFCAATCGAAWWLLHGYPKWVRDTHRPGGLPVRNDLQRGLPPALIAFGRVAPLFFLPSGFLGFALIVGKWTEKAWTRGDSASLAAGGPVLITSAFVLLAARYVWPREDDRLARAGGESARPSGGVHPLLRAWAPFFAVCSGLLGIAMLLGRARSILDSAERWEVVLCGLSIVATAAFAMGLSSKVKPLDKSGLDGASPPTRRTEHA